MGWIIATAALAFFTLLPAGLMAYAWHYCASVLANPRPSPSKLPEVAVILSLRGADPSLERCLAGLFAQNYYFYRVYIIVDSPEDPALAVVSAMLARGHGPHVNVQVEVRHELSDRCGLKLSAQRQVLMKLDDTVDVVAFLDADLVPRPDWLRSMIAPFGDPKIGATSGIRWHTLGNGAWGPLVRYAFSAFSFSQMLLFSIPWGGSFAIRKHTIDAAGLVETWSHCLAEDTSAYGPIKGLGQRIAFVPAATQINNETTTLVDAYKFILRQLVCVRLHHIYWRRLFAVSAAVHLSWLASALLAVAGLAGALVTGDAGFLMLGAMAVFPLGGLIGVTFMVAKCDRLVRGVMNAPPLKIKSSQLLGVISFGLFVTSLAVYHASLKRSITWREITYDFSGRDRINMRAYQAYSAETNQSAVEHSVI